MTEHTCQHTPVYIHRYQSPYIMIVYLSTGAAQLEVFEEAELVSQSIQKNLWEFTRRCRVLRVYLLARE